MCSPRPLTAHRWVWDFVKVANNYAFQEEMFSLQIVTDNSLSMKSLRKPNQKINQYATHNNIADTVTGTTQNYTVTF